MAADPQIRGQRSALTADVNRGHVHHLSSVSDPQRVLNSTRVHSSDGKTDSISTFLSYRRCVDPEIIDAEETSETSDSGKRQIMLVRFVLISEVRLSLVSTGSLFHRAESNLLQIKSHIFIRGVVSGLNSLAGVFLFNTVSLPNTASQQTNDIFSFRSSIIKFFSLSLTLKVRLSLSFLNE